MSFFKTLFLICRGPYVFASLRKNSWMRVMMNLMQMLLLCSVMVYLGHYGMLKLRWRETEAEFRKSFGHGVSFSESSGYVPEKSPGVSRSLTLPYCGTLIYSGQNSKEAYSDEMLKDKNFILLWSAAGFGVAVRSNQDWIYVHQGPEGVVRVIPEPTDYAGMRAKLENSRSLPDKHDWKGVNPKWDYISVRALFNNIRFCMALVQTIGYFCKAFYLAAIFTGVFTLVTVMINRIFGGRGKGIPGDELWKCGIYASFPILFIVSFFPAFQLTLPVKYYSEIFVAGWLIYMLFIMRYVSLIRRAEADAAVAAKESGDEKKDDAGDDK